MQRTQEEACAGLLTRALQFHRQGDLSSAREHYERILVVNPTHFDALHLSGVIAMQLGNNDKGIEFVKRALVVMPASADAWSNLGNGQMAVRDHAGALASFDRAIALDPRNANAHYNRGIALAALLRYDEALASYQRVIDLQPGDASAHNNYGATLALLDRHEESMKHFARAIQCDPRHAGAYNNYGAAFSQLNRHDEAIVHFTRATECDPGHASAHFNLGVVHLVRGEWKKGLALYEWRWKRDDAEKPLPFDVPQWRGEDLRGRRIVLWSEQGFGDTLFACRFAKDVRQLGARVILAVQPELVELLKSLDGADEVVSRNGPIPHSDFHCPLMSVLYALDFSLEKLPKLHGFLRAPHERIAAWGERIGPAPGVKIGIACSGTPRHLNDRNRSLPLHMFAPLLRDGVTLFLVQKALRPNDKVWLQTQPQIRDLWPQLKDFADTAAAMEYLDVIVTVDTSVAHLAAALGKPTWILLPFSADWRYLLERSDSLGTRQRRCTGKRRQATGNYRYDMSLAKSRSSWISGAGNTLDMY